MNRRAQPVGIEDRTPQALLPDGLTPVAAPGADLIGRDTESLLGVARVADQWADRAARVEGQREGAVAGTDPAYRPDGATTIRGVSRQEAAVTTYYNNLAAETSRTTQRIYDEWWTQFRAGQATRADLTARLAGAREEIERRDVFPEILGSFRSRYATIETSLLRQGDEVLRAREDDQARAAFAAAQQASRDTVQRAVVAAPDAPETQAVVRRETEARVAAVRRQAAAGLITAERAVEMERAARDEGVIAPEIGRAERATTVDQVERQRTELRERFGRGEFAGSADGYAALDRALQQRAAQIRTQTNRTQSEIDTRLDSIVRRARDGLPAPAAEVDAVREQARQTDGGRASLALAEAQLRIVEAVRRMPLTTANEMMAQIRAQVQREGATANAAELVRFGEALVRDQQQQLDRDPLALARSRGVIAEIPPLDYAAAPDVLGRQIAERMAAARQVGRTFGRQPTFFTGEEAARLGEVVTQGGDRALQIVQAIVQGAGRDAPSVLRELGGRAPELAGAGAILAGGGSIDAARDALAGVQARGQPGARVQTVPPAERFRIIGEVIGPAMQSYQHDRERVLTTADAIFQARAARENIPQNRAAEAWRRALQEALGQRTENGVAFGGVANYRPGWWVDYRVMVPAEVRADQFRDVIRSIRPEDFEGLPQRPERPNGQPYAIDDIRSAIPVRMGAGYAFATQDPAGDDPRYIRGSDGRPFVLPWDAAAVNRFRARVPGAFRAAP